MARIRQDAKVTALKSSPLFEGLSKRQLLDVARLTDDLEVPAGAVLCQQGSRGQEFFVIIDGEADVTRDGRSVARIGPGDFFGEIALLEDVMRTATVTATTPLRFFIVSSRAFQGVLEADPAVERRILYTLARRVVSQTGDPGGA